MPTQPPGRPSPVPEAWREWFTSAPPAAPRRRPRLIAAVAALVALALAAAVLVYVQRTDSAGAAIRHGAALLRATEAVRLDIWVDDAGQLTSGQLTVTADGYATGVLTDARGGRADVLSGAGGIALRADRTWWARRSPKQVGGLADRWIRPVEGVTYPFDLARVLTPTALADRLDALAGAARDDPDQEPWSGRSARRVVSGEWSAVLAPDHDRRVLWLGGPLPPDQITRPPTALGRPRTVPAAAAVASGRDGLVLARHAPVAIPPYVAVVPVPADAGDAVTVREAVAKVLPEAQPAPGQAVTEPLAQRTAKPEYASFKVQVNATDCNAPTCTWTVTVTNDGPSPGEGTLYASATPGMLRRPFAVQLAPGASFTTEIMSFSNPAPDLRGRNTRVVITYQAWVFQPSLGVEPAIPQRLAERGINPDNDVTTIDPEYMPTVLRLLDAMTRHTPTTDLETSRKALNALNHAIGKRLLPELRAITDSRHLANPEVLIQKLSEVPDEADSRPFIETPRHIGYRREVEQVAEILRQDPAARLILDGAVRNPDTGELDGADILDTHNRIAYQLKSVMGNRLVPALHEAVKQLNGETGINTTGIRQKAPPGYERLVLIYLEPRSKQHNYDGPELAQFLRYTPEHLRLCEGGVARLDRLTIVNARGVFTWQKGEFDAFGHPC